MSTIGAAPSSGPRTLGSAIFTTAVGLTRSLVGALLPPTCCLCGYPGLRQGLDLCALCAESLPRNAGHMACPQFFTRALVPFLYAYPVDRFVRSLKFRGERMYARVLGMLLAEAFRESGAPPPPVLVPVPLHPLRYRERGFNQALEIAHYAAGDLGVPVDAGCLARVVATREQSGLPLVERRRNVHGAFRALRAPRASRIALVDDVLTTGNTFSAAAHALIAFGVENIELWAPARVEAGTGRTQDAGGILTPT